MASSSQKKTSDSNNRLEQQVQEIYETANLSRLILLNVQSQIDRLNAQLGTTHSQLEKIDRLHTQITNTHAYLEKVERSIEKVNSSQEALTSSLNDLKSPLNTLQNTQHFQDIQSHLDKIDVQIKTQQNIVIDSVKSIEQNLDIVKKYSGLNDIQSHIETSKETLRIQQDIMLETLKEIKKELTNPKNYKERFDQIDIQLSQCALKGDLTAFSEQFNTTFKEQQKNYSSLNIEDLASKPDIGEVIVRLQQMQVTEKESISILGQRVAQMPTSHQLAQIYFKIDQKASTQLVFFLWVILILTIMLGFIFQPQINATLERYWNLLLSIVS